MKKIPHKNTRFRFSPHSVLAFNLLAVFFLLFAFEAKADWFWKKKETCEWLVDDFIKQGIQGIKNLKQADHVKNTCYDIILKTGDYKELHAYYRLYKYADEINTKYNKKNNINKDQAPNNIYHYMLFYANENSRIFNEKTQDFEKEQGLYEQELKDFEDKMNQEEKIKSFSYIADNLATGKEGWVKKHDYKKSFEYLKRAAEAGDSRSQSKLAECYILGSDWMRQFSITKDNILAYKWTYLSTLHSKQRGWEYEYIKTKRMKTLEQKITPQQIYQAKQQANLWLQQNKEFIKSHPLEIIPMTQEEIKSEKEKTAKFIKDYKLDQPLSTN